MALIESETTTEPKTLRKKKMPKDLRDWLRAEQRRLGISFENEVMYLKLRVAMEAEVNSSPIEV